MQPLSLRGVLLTMLTIAAGCCFGCAGRSTTGDSKPVAIPPSLQESSWPLPSELPDAEQPIRHTSANEFLSSDYAGIIEELTRSYSFAGANIQLSPTDAGNLYLPNLAYVTFDFWAPGPIDPPVIKADFVGIEPGQQQVFIGLANWTTDRWDWHNTGTVLAIDDFAPYVEPETARLVVVLLVSGDEPLILRELRVGQGGIGEPSWRLIQPSAYPAERTSLQIVNKYYAPAVLAVEKVAEGADYRETAMLYRCRDEQGFDWQPPVVVYRSLSVNSPLRVQAAVVGGRPAVVVEDLYADTVFISYSRSEDEYGAVWPAEFPLMETGDPAEGFSPIKLLEADGLPAVVVSQGSRTLYFSALDVDGAPWRPVVELGLDETARDAMMLNGRPGILTSRSIIGENALHFFWANDAAGLSWPANGAVVYSHFEVSDFFYQPRLLNLFTNPAVILLPGLGQGLSMIASSQPDGSVWPATAVEIDDNGYSVAAGALSDGSGFDTFVASINQTVTPLNTFFSSDGFGANWLPGQQLAFEGSSPTELVGATIHNHAVFATTSTNPTDGNLSHLQLYWY